MANLNLPRKHSEASTILSSCSVCMYDFHQHDNKIESTRGHTGYILCDHTMAGGILMSLESRGDPGNIKGAWS